MQPSLITTGKDLIVVLEALKKLEFDPSGAGFATRALVKAGLTSEAIDANGIAALRERLANAQAPETYGVMAVSTAHLTMDDHQHLHAQSEDSNMVMARDTGYFIKLYQDPEHNDSLAMNRSANYSDTLNELIRFAVRNGYQMIEFDADAHILEEFTTQVDAH